MTRRTNWFRSARLRRKQLAAHRGERSLAANSKFRNRRLLLEKLEDRTLLAVIASDGFETANFSGGSGWTGAWTAAGDATVISSNGPLAGAYHARLRSGTGDLQRSVDISGLTDVKLQFWSKVSSFESSDQALVSVRMDGGSWTTLQSFTSAQSDNTYHSYELAIPGAGSTVDIRFDAAMSASNDQWYIDDVQITHAPPPVPGLVSWWTGDNTASDDAGKNEGTLVNGTTYSTGQIGQAFSFDGVNDRVGVADSDSLKLTQSMTIEGWVKANSIPVPGQQGEILFRGDDRGGLDPYSLSVQSNGSLRFEVSSLAGAASVSTSMPVGQFVHIVGTLDDATGAMRLYLNGVLMSQTVTTVRPFGDLDSASNPGIGIGNHGGYPSTPHNFPFNGLIDELKVYNISLTGAEVVANFQATKGNLLPAISINDVTVTESDQAYVGQPLVPTHENGPVGGRTLLRGPDDGRIYVASHDTDSVKIYADGTGELLGELATAGGELDGPWGMAFGPDNFLYVGGRYSRNIVRFNTISGASEVFATSAGSDLGIPLSLAFDASGDLYASSRVEGELSTAGTVKRFAAGTGAFLGNFVTPGSGKLANPYGIAFGPDGKLYVASSASMEIKRYDGQTGAFIDNFIPSTAGGLANPGQISFHTDGKLYVASQSNQRILRYDAATGEFLDIYVSGLGSAPAGLAFSPSGVLNLSLGTSVARVVPGVLPLVASLSFPSESPITVSFATSNGLAVAGSDYVGTSGTVTFQPGELAKEIPVQLLDDSTLEATENLSVNLSSPIGATIADGSGVVTIQDDETASAISISDVTVLEGDLSPHYRGNYLEGTNGELLQLAFHAGIAYVGTGSNTIRRYEATSGQFIDTFVPGGTIQGVRDIRFQGAYMYVGSEYTDQVLRYHIADGTFDRVFVAAGTGIDGTHGMTFGPDANSDNIPELYVSGRNSHNVVRYDGATGDPLPGTYIAAGSGGLSWPEGLTFDPSGTTLLVSSPGTNRILKYDAQTGAFLGDAASTNLQGPLDVKFGPDGLMYVASAANDRIIRFTANGTYVDDYVPAGSAGMDYPYRVHFGPDGDVFVTNLPSKNILRFGSASEIVFTVSRGTALPTSATVTLATVDGSAIAGDDYTAVGGTLTISPGATTSTIRVPIFDDAASEGFESFLVQLSAAIGGIVLDGQGVGTIVDDDAPPTATKFYVVDSSADRTFEYNKDGQSLAGEDWGLAAANTNPRGATSNAFGDRLWVVDSAGKVYVYDNDGNALGTWTAGGVRQAEGITTDGANIWIVDARDHRTLYYAGAAQATSGTIQPTSTFNLSAVNDNPTGITTDGTYIWINDDDKSNGDNIWRYTLAGVFQGGWDLPAPNTKAAGITIDPSGASDHIWVVDSGTDQVYEYSGIYDNNFTTLTLVGVFNLAAGNTNPTDIADPPVGDSTPAAVDASISGEFAAQVLSGFPAMAATGQVSTLTGEHDEDVVVIYLSEIESLPAQLTGDVGMKSEPSSPAIRLSCTQDDALCSVIDELDSTLLKGRRSRPGR